MGYIRNHAIVVTATYDKHMDRAHEEASKIFPWVSPISPEATNGTRSFFVPPDGSKEGWEESETGDAKREQFKTWLRAQAYEDGSTPLHWCEVRYGGDDDDAAVEAHCRQEASHAR